MIKFPRGPSTVRGLLRPPLEDRESGIETSYKICGIIAKPSYTPVNK